MITNELLHRLYLKAKWKYATVDLFMRLIGGLLISGLGIVSFFTASFAFFLAFVLLCLVSLGVIAYRWRTVTESQIYQEVDHLLQDALLPSVRNNTDLAFLCVKAIALFIEMKVVEVDEAFPESAKRILVDLIDLVNEHLDVLLQHPLRTSHELSKEGMWRLYKDFEDLEKLFQELLEVVENQANNSHRAARLGHERGDTGAQIDVLAVTLRELQSSRRNV